MQVIDNEDTVSSVQSDICDIEMSIHCAVKDKDVNQLTILLDRLKGDGSYVLMKLIKSVAFISLEIYPKATEKSQRAPLHDACETEDNDGKTMNIVIKLLEK